MSGLQGPAVLNHLGISTINERILLQYIAASQTKSSNLENTLIKTGINAYSYKFNSCFPIHCHKSSLVILGKFVKLYNGRKLKQELPIAHGANHAKPCKEKFSSPMTDTLEDRIIPTDLRGEMWRSL